MRTHLNELTDLILPTFPVTSNPFLLLGPYSSVVEVGICSGILVSFRPEQSTTPDSQRHLGGHTGSLLQALLTRASSVPGEEVYFQKCTSGNLLSSPLFRPLSGYVVEGNQGNSLKR